MMYSPKRLHPITLLINMMKQIKEIIIPLILFFILDRQRDSSFFLFLTIISALFACFSGVVKWIRFRYWIEDGELRIKYGLFVQKKRYIPFERIQSLNLSETILHRPFNLVKVSVETAGSSLQGNKEAELVAIKKEEALAIQNFLHQVKTMDQKEESMVHTEGKELILYEISGKELLFLASTSGTAGVIISGFIAFFSQFGEFIRFHKLLQGLESIVANGMLFVSIVLLFMFFALWIMSVVITVFRYGDFTLKKVENDLVVTRGILEKRQLTIPLERIQGIRIRENILRQLFGYASVYIESAGGTEEEGAKIIILPLIMKRRIHQILEKDLDGLKVNVTFRRSPQRALKRYIGKTLIGVFSIIVIFTVIFKGWGLFSLFLIPTALIYAYFWHKDAGWDISGNQLALQYRLLVKNTIFMKRNKIQSLEIKQSPIQKRKGLATMKASIKSGIGQSGGKVLDLEEKDVVQIYRWYSRTADLGQS